MVMPRVICVVWFVCMMSSKRMISLYLAFVFLVVVENTTAHLLELAPFRVLIVKLASIVGEEEEGEDCKQHSPEGSPQADVVYERGEADPVVDDLGCQLHVEGDGI